MPLFSLLHAFSLNPTLHHTSYSYIFCSLSISLSHFTPLSLSYCFPLPSLLLPLYVFLIKYITTYCNCYYNCPLCYSRFKRVMLILCLQHVDVHMELTPSVTPFTCDHLSMTPSTSMCTLPKAHGKIAFCCPPNWRHT